MKKRISIFIYFIFLYVIMFSFFFTPKLLFSSNENRILAQKPSFNISSIIENNYTKNIDTYIEDHFPFRNFFIKVNSLLEGLYNIKEKNDVIYGKNNFLFDNIIENKKNIDFNLSSIDNFSKKIKSYLLIVPSSQDVYPENMPNGYVNFDTKHIVQSIYNSYNNIEFIDVYDKFINNKEIKLFYNTDHHWTIHGAKLAYETIMNTFKLNPINLEHQTEKKFKGSLYLKTNRFSTKYEDFEYYINDKIQLYINDKQYPIIDSSKLKSNDKYASLLQGNNSLSTIKGSGSGKILIIKDSYANAMLPLISSNFGKLDIIDLRYYNKNIYKLCREELYDKILFIYGIRTLNNERSTGTYFSLQEET